MLAVWAWWGEEVPSIARRRPEGNQESLNANSWTRGTALHALGCPGKPAPDGLDG